VDTKDLVIDNIVLGIFGRNFDKLTHIKSGNNQLIVEFMNGKKKLILPGERINVNIYSRNNSKIKSITLKNTNNNNIELFTIDKIGFDSSDNTTRWIIFILIVLAVYYFYNKNK
jgi:hypothetical protein